MLPAVLVKKGPILSEPQERSPSRDHHHFDIGGSSPVTIILLFSTVS